MGIAYQNHFHNIEGMLFRLAGEITEHKLVGYGTQLPIVPLASEQQHNLGRKGGNILFAFLKRRRRLRLRRESRVVREFRRLLYEKVKQEMETPLEEDDRRVVFGKTDLQFDEGAGGRALSHHPNSLLY